MIGVDPKTLEAISQLLLQGGAIVALVWVVLLLTGGKLHTSSEIEGLRQDKEALLAVNERVSTALALSNELLKSIIEKRR